MNLEWKSKKTRIAIFTACVALLVSVPVAREARLYFKYGRQCEMPCGCEVHPELTKNSWIFSGCERIAECVASHCWSPEVIADESERYRLHLAAQKGDAKAQYNLAFYYERDKDFINAYFWASLAAQAGYESAMPVRDELKKQLTLEQEAAVQKRLQELKPDAGKSGVAAQTASALAALNAERVAAGKGHVPAIAKLADRYEQGDGVEQDYVEAYKWLTIYAAMCLSPGPMDQIRSRRDRLGKKMTEAQVSEARRRTELILSEKAKGGDVGAQSLLARVYAEGLGQIQNYEEAYFWYRVVFNAGHEIPARMYLHQIGEHLSAEQVTAIEMRAQQFKPKPRNWPREINIPNELSKRAEVGSAPAAYEIGNLFFGYDMETAADWYRLAAVQGHAQAQWKLAVIYATDDVPDLPESYKWAHMAAEQGIPDAQAQLGYDFAHGHGVKQDDEEAYFWYSLAARTKDPDSPAAYITAQGALGQLSQKLTEVQKDRVVRRIQDWTLAKQRPSEEPAAEFSFSALLPPPVEQPRHCSVSYQWPAFIAGLYERGEVLPKNLPKAAELYLVAASKTDVDPTNQGLNAIRYKLGTLYLEGVGVEQDYVEAYFWVSLAAAISEKYSAAMARLGEKVPKERVEEVKKRVVEFLAKSQPDSILVRCTDVTPNFVRELQARRRAAENGNPVSQSLLAESYMGAYDYEDAAFWATLALSDKKCEPSRCQGSAYNVLDRIIDKLTPEQKSKIKQRVKEWKPQQMALDYAQTWELTDPIYKSAHEGNAAAQYALGSMYADTQDYRKNLGEAYLWYGLAAKAQPDNTVYSSHRDAIKAALTPREVEILDGRIRTWKPTPAEPVTPDSSSQ